MSKSEILLIKLVPISLLLVCLTRGLRLILKNLVYIEYILLLSLHLLVVSREVWLLRIVLALALLTLILRRTLLEWNIHLLHIWPDRLVLHRPAHKFAALVDDNKVILVDVIVHVVAVLVLIGKHLEELHKVRIVHVFGVDRRFWVRRLRFLLTPGYFLLNRVTSINHVLYVVKLLSIEVVIVDGGVMVEMILNFDLRSFLQKLLFVFDAK